MGQALRSSVRNPIQAMLALVFVFVTVVSFLPCIDAQPFTAFTTSDHFDIPALSGSIRFTYNGTCTQARLENNTWFFSSLSLNGSRPQGDLAVSVSNSNITIYSFTGVGSVSNLSRKVVRYNAQGSGQQVINMGVNGTTDVSEWWVTITGSIFLAEGKDWHLARDNTVTVTGQTGNVSVAHYNFGATNSEDKPFFWRHSVALLTVVAVAVTVTAAVLISVKRRRR
jgi:hypothetical protein